MAKKPKINPDPPPDLSGEKDKVAMVVTVMRDDTVRIWLREEKPFAYLISTMRWIADNFEKNQAVRIK